MTEVESRPTVIVEWDTHDKQKSTYPKRSTVEIPIFILEDYHCRGAGAVTDYLTCRGFNDFEWEWIDEENVKNE